MFSTVVSFGSQHDILGLAAANIDVRAFSWQIMPALANDSVCCSCKHTYNAGSVILKKSYHDLMKDGPGIITHFVEFINTTNSIITQYKSTTTNTK